MRPRIPAARRSRRRLLVGAGRLAGRPRARAAARLAPPAGTRLGRGDGGRARHASRPDAWAADTWRSLVAMTDPETGLPADNIPESLAARRPPAATRRRRTSAATCGRRSWPASSASSRRARHRAGSSGPSKTLDAMEHHEPSGMYYNWYDEATGDVAAHLARTRGDRVYPFVSSVDNGWLGAALLVVKNADRARRGLGRGSSTGCAGTRSTTPTRDPGSTARRPHARRLLRRRRPPPGRSGFTGTHIGIGPDVWLDHPPLRHHGVGDPDHDATSGIITGQIPAAALLRAVAHLPGDLRLVLAGDAAGRRDPHLLRARRLRGRLHLPGHAHRTRLGRLDVRGAHARVFVPEERWAPHSWGVNHPLHVRAQREHGLDDAGYGYWGFSPSSDPRRRLPRVRRRRARASTPTATSPTRRRPTSTSASATAGRRRTRTRRTATASSPRTPRSWR